MPRRPIDDLRRCTCTVCQIESPDGVLLPPLTVSDHLRQERVRNAVRIAVPSPSALRRNVNAGMDSNNPHALFVEDENNNTGSAFAEDSNKEPSESADSQYFESIQGEIESRLVSQYAENTLEFINVPSQTLPFQYPDPIHILQFNSGQFALKINKACNRRFLDNESRFCSLLRDLQNLPSDEPREIVEDALYTALERLHRFKSTHYSMQAYPNGRDGKTVNNSRHFASWGHLKANTEIAAIWLAALIIYIKFHTPVRQMRVILALLRWISTRRRPGQGNVSSSQIPQDIHTIVSHYDLEPRTRTFLCCSRCFTLQPLTSEGVNQAELSYKNHGVLPVCVAKSAPDAVVCGNPLWRTRRIGNRTFVVPVRTQVFQDFREWLGGILAIPGMEDRLHSTPGFQSGCTADFMDSPLLREFKGVDGKPFLRQTSDTRSDLRLVMSLGSDGFNPFGNTIRGATLNCTGIYMVLLSLPEHLRYQQKYLYLVTVVSGKPQHNINHSLAWLVDELLPFWKEGVYYSRTANCTFGRRAFVALIPIVCDAEAAAQIAGFAGHSHHYFCRRCFLQLKDIDNLDPETWPKRNWEEHKEIALLWKESSVSTRQDLYDRYGLRYSELLRLPYIDLLSFTVFDSMHFGDLGLFESHIRDFLKIDAERNGGEGLRTATPHRNKDILIGRIVEWRALNTADQVPTIPLLNYQVRDLSNNQLDLGEETDTSVGEVSGSDVSMTDVSTIADSDLEMAVDESDPEPPAVAQGKGYKQPINVKRDSTFSAVLSQVQNFNTPSPDYKRTKKADLQALCQDLDIPFLKKDTKPNLIARIRKYRKDHGTPTHLNTLTTDSSANPDLMDVKYANDKRKFEAKELSLGTIKTFGRPILERLCREYNIPPFNNAQISRSITNGEMAKRLMLWRQEFRDGVLRPPSTPRSVVGKDILEEVNKDMKTTILPSWVSQVQEKWGTKAGGTLGADEWRTLCSISLVITLVRIWGYEHEEDSRYFQMLLNFLDLVHALHAFSLRETSPAHQAYYLSHILKYTQGLVTLFPDVSLKPNHHYAIHAVDDLKLMGPPHARSTPVFERINHILQQTNFNRHLGEIERTMLISYCREGNLQSLLDDDTALRAQIEEVIKTMDSINKEDHRGMFSGTDQTVWSSTTFPSSPTRITAADDLNRISDLLCQQYGIVSNHWAGQLRRDAKVLEGIAVGRVIYSRRAHENSVIFCDAGSIFAGTIQQVFSHCHRHPTTGLLTASTYFRICVLEPVDIGDDLYRELNCGWLCKRPQPTERTLIVPMANMVSHFARTDFIIQEQSVTHVLPLNKVFHSDPSGRPKPGPQIL